MKNPHDLVVETKALVVESRGVSRSGVGGWGWGVEDPLY